MDEHWVEVPPSRRRESRRDEDYGDRTWDRDRDRSRGKRDSERHGRESRGRDSREREARYRRSPTLGRDRSPSPKDRSASHRSSSRRSRDRYSDRRQSTSRSPSPIRDRKGKRRADDYEQRDRSDDERRDRKGKGRAGYDGTRGGTRERGAERWETGVSHTKGRNDDELQNRNHEQKGKYNHPDHSAGTSTHNDERRGKDDTRKRWNEGDETGSAHYRDDGRKAHSLRFSGPVRSARPDDPVRDNQPTSYSSRHRFSSEDNDDYSPRRASHPYEERKSHKSTLHEHDLGSSNRRWSHEHISRPSKRTRSPSPKSKQGEMDRDQKRAATDGHTEHDSHSSTWSENTRSHELHGAHQPRSLSTDTQTRSRSRSTSRPAHHNVQEPKTSEVEHSSTAHVDTPLGPPTPTETQPRDTTHTDDKTKVERHRAPRLTPLASIRAHLQGGSRSSDGAQDTMKEGVGIKASPSRSIMQVESSATNCSTLLPNAVQRSSPALSTTNTNIHVNPDSSEEPNVSYSILGAAARSQVQPPLITARSDSTQRVCPSSTVGRNRLVLARLEALRTATDSTLHLSEKAQLDEALPEKTPTSPTLPDSSGNQSATNTRHDDDELPTSPNRQLGADPADVNTPAARFQVERRLKLQARLAARKREINAVMGAKDPFPL
jgi:hypothetical protein